MSNVYTLYATKNKKLIDMSEIPHVSVHGAGGWDHAEKLLKKGIDPWDLQSHFCPNCLNPFDRGEGETTCSCIEDIKKEFKKIRKEN